MQKLGGIKEVRKVLEDGAELDDLRKRAADAMSAMGAYSGCGRRLAAAAREAGGGGGSTGRVLGSF